MRKTYDIRTEKATVFSCKIGSGLKVGGISYPKTACKTLIIEYILVHPMKKAIKRKFMKKAFRIAESSKGKHFHRLEYKKPFHFNQVLSFMKRRAIKGVEVVTETGYSRTFRIKNAKGYFTITDNPDQSALELRITCDNIGCHTDIINRVRKMFDLDLDGLGIPRTKQTTLKTVTQAILDQRVKLTTHQPFETFRENFLALKGIGEWTVHYVAMRGLRMVDSFPATDLGVIKALTEKGRVPSRKEIKEMAEQCAPTGPMLLYVYGMIAEKGTADPSRTGGCCPYWTGVKTYILTIWEQRLPDKCIFMN